MGQQGYIMNQKGLKMHEKRQKIEFSNLKCLLFSGIFHSRMGPVSAHSIFLLWQMLLLFLLRSFYPSKKISSTSIFPSSMFPSLMLFFSFENQNSKFLEHKAEFAQFTWCYLTLFLVLYLFNIPIFAFEVSPTFYILVTHI